MNVTRNAAGWIALCDCGWERMDARRPALDAAIAKHTCPKVREPKQAKTAARRSTAWDDREGPTWIDQM